MSNIRVVVKGPARGRLALGVVTAYIKLNPHLTYKELKEAFPDDIYRKAPVQIKSIEPLGVFQLYDVVMKLPEQGLTVAHFVKEDEVIELASGEKIVVTRPWTKMTFNKLVEVAKRYGVEVRQEGDAEPFKQTDFTLEFLEYTPKKRESVERKVESKVVEQPVKKSSSSRKMYAALLGILLLLVVCLVGFIFIPKWGSRSKDVAPDIKTIYLQVNTGASLVNPEDKDKVLTLSIQIPNSGKVDVAARGQLDQVVMLLKQKKERKVMVTAYRVMSNTSNKNILQRSEIVESYLKDKGVSEKRIIAAEKEATKGKSTQAVDIVVLE